MPLCLPVPAEKLRCVLELVNNKEKATDNTDIVSESTGVRATTYFLLPSTVPGEGERAIQRGEPFVFTCAHSPAPPHARR